MPMSRMGELATAMLVDSIAGRPIEHEIVPDPPELVIRASTARPST
jgi:DNA-binding LacI/PurR family transcriptional regulator